MPRRAESRLGPVTPIPDVVLSNGGGDPGRQHRDAEVLRTGLFYSASRFRLIEGFPEPAEWLEVFETDARDPLDTYARATSPVPSSASELQPELSRSFRLAHAHGASPGIG